MSATNLMRAMLDGLMGTNRHDKIAKHPFYSIRERPKIEFDDSRVCKCHFFDCCPHDVLAGTRMDLGECSNIHDPALKADFLKCKRKEDYNYEKEAFRNLEKFLSNIDKKVKMAIRDLQMTQEELPDGTGEIAEEIHKLGEDIGTKLVEAEKFGAEGQVEESLKLMHEVEELNRKKNASELKLRNAIPAHQYQQQKLRVCDICSAYLGIQDNDRRLADHFGGKLHLGFITLRSKLEEMEKLSKKNSERYRRRSPNSSSSRYRERSRSNHRDRHRRHSRSRSRRSDRHSRH